MQLYSLIGAAALIGSGLAGAVALGHAAQARVEQIDALIAFVRYVRVQVECFSMPIPEILERAEPALLRACGCQGSGGERLDHFFVACSIADKEAEQLLLRMAATFGKGYREEQLQQCAYYLDGLTRRREELAAQLPKKKKLDATLCICLALAVAVLLL